MTTVDDIAIKLFVAKVIDHSNYSDADMLGITNRASIEVNMNGRTAHYGGLQKDTLPEKGSTIIIGHAIYDESEFPSSYFLYDPEKGETIGKSKHRDTQLYQYCLNEKLELGTLTYIQDNQFSVKTDSGKISGKSLKPAKELKTGFIRGLLRLEPVVLYTPDKETKPTEIFLGRTGEMMYKR